MISQSFGSKIVGNLEAENFRLSEGFSQNALSGHSGQTMALQKQLAVSNILMQTEPKFDKNSMFNQSLKKIRTTHSQDILRTGNF